MFPSSLRTDLLESIRERITEYYLPRDMECDNEVLEDWLINALDLEDEIAASFVEGEDEGWTLDNEIVRELANMLHYHPELLNLLWYPPSLEVFQHVVHELDFEEEDLCEECIQNLEALHDAESVSDGQDSALHLLMHVISNDDDEETLETSVLQQLLNAFVQLPSSAQFRVLASAYAELEAAEAGEQAVDASHLLAIWRAEYLDPTLRHQLDLAVRQNPATVTLSEAMLIAYRSSLREFCQDKGLGEDFSPLEIEKDKVEWRSEYLRPMRAILRAERDLLDHAADELDDI